MTRTITVSDVPRASTPLEVSDTVKTAIESLSHAPVEACSKPALPALNLGFHPFVAALHLAFATHRPLVISPDMLWLLVAQGFARVVNEDPDGMRGHFVAHQDKATIEVRRDEFVLGSQDNDWPGVFAEFSTRIREHIGAGNHESIVVRFSTTGPIEQAANEIVLMDAMQSYFDYEVMTLCGIPEVELEGTEEDWSRVAERTRRLGERYDCRWWIDHAAPWLERVAASAAGASDRELWQSMYKLDDSSGGPFATGWISQLFPYLGRDSRRNPLLGKAEAKPGFEHGVTTDAWPGSMSVAPFTWKYYDQRLAMEFIAGFTHFTQDQATMSLRPAIGWAVRSAAG